MFSKIDLSQALVVTKVLPLQVCVLLGNGLINGRILFLEVLILSEFLIFQSNLFDSITVEGKKVFLTKPCFTFINGILIECTSDTVILVFHKNRKVFYTNVVFKSLQA